MNHTEKIIDTNSIFEIDAITRTIKNTSNSKITIIQHDHDSERFTFKIPRYIENHDMKECNLVEVHYVNVDSTTNEEKKDRYIVKDLKVDEDSENMMKFTWLLSEKATSQVGSLRFAVRFSCVLEDGKVEYAWNTAPYKDITVTTGLYNKEEIRSDAISDLFARIDKIETTGGTGSGGGNVEIVDNHTTNDATKALSARQGKVLYDEISELGAYTHGSMIWKEDVNNKILSEEEAKKVDEGDNDVMLNAPYFSAEAAKAYVKKYVSERLSSFEGDFDIDLEDYFTKDETLQRISGIAEDARNHAENEIKIALENYYDKEAIDGITEPLSEIAKNQKQIQNELYGSNEPINIFDASAVLDNSIIQFKPTSNPIGNYNQGILSGFQAVREGSTYYIQTDGAALIGAVAFFDKNKYPVCARGSSANGLYGQDQNWWPAIDGFIEIEAVDQYTRKVSVLADSGISFMVWYFSNPNTGQNYFGTHTDEDVKNIIEGMHLYEERESLTEKVNNIYDIVSKGNNLSKSNVVLTKNGDNIQVRSAWDDTNDIYIRANLYSSSNKTFNLNRMATIPNSTDYQDITIEGTQFKNVGDDITPVYFNSSYLGANHGYYPGYTITCSTAHGLTESNIGEEWVDGGNTKAVILKIISNTEILIGFPNYEKNVNYPFTSHTPVSPITKDEQSVTFTTSKQSQITPAVNHIHITVNANGKTIEEDGIYNCEYVDVVETYDIIHIPTMVEYLKNNVGSNTNDSLCSEDIAEKYCTISNVYRFTERGAMTLYQSIDFDKSVNFSFAGMVQSMSIGNYYCVPGTIYSMLSELGSEGVSFAPESWNKSDYPPTRYYQYADGGCSKGICLGYNTEIGDGNPETRKNIKGAGNIMGSSKKLYPYLTSVSNTVEAGHKVQAVSYRVPLRAYDSDIPSVGWYYVGDDIYLLLDVQDTVDKYITLPNHMVGRKITVIEELGDISIFPEFVGSNGIKVKVTDYGSGIYKLTRN